MMVTEKELNEIFRKMVITRCDLHRHPELGFQESRTSGVIQQRLSDIGLTHIARVAQTGVVAIIDGNRPGKTVMLRFDMDGLPIKEDTGLPFASQNPGIMHACGHDGHVAVGLAVAEMLISSQDFPGKVKLVFQPAEEGLGGAERMIKEGVLSDPTPDACLGLHLWNQEEVGWFGIKSGGFMAGSETFEIRVTGKGGHGAMPDQARDPVVAGAAIISALQTIVSRGVPPLEGGVVTVASIHAGEAHNVIPQHVDMTGTIRFFKTSVKNEINRRFHKIVTQIADSLDCDAQIDIIELTPAVWNDEKITSLVKAAAQETYSSFCVDSEYQVMASEDMAFYLEKIPGCFFFVGAGSTSGYYPHHHPKFDFDEQAMKYGANLMFAAARDVLAGL